MRTIGVIGGMSWESTAVYYRLFNEAVKARLGGLHSAPLLLHSVDFHDIERLQASGDWDAAGALLAASARSLEGAGAALLVLATNTMHKVAPAIEAAVRIPFVHIADAAGKAIRDQGLTRVALLGTRFTMHEPFYRERLQQRFGIEVLLPDAAEQAQVHRVIYEELCLGQFLDASREAYLRIIARLQGAGAQGVVLGCTEIGLLIKPEDVALPLFDTAALHVDAAVTQALADA